MKTYAVEQIRNVGLFGHGSAGKTSLSEGLLYVTHGASRLGRVEDGNTVSDWDPDEIKRTISISTSLIPLEYRDHKINILDAPGYADFFGEIRGALCACDIALIMIDASAGVEVGTEQAWDASAEAGIPRALVINKMDRENANFEESLNSAQTAFGASVVPVQMPIGSEKEFSGFVDLLSRQAYRYDDGNSGTAVAIDLPGELADAVDALRTQLIEKICEADEELMMRYLDDDDIAPDELKTCLKTSIASNDAVPVFVTGATTCKGLIALLDGIVDLFPAPQPRVASNSASDNVSLSPDPGGELAALVFKTVADPYVGKLSMFRVFRGKMTSDSHVFDAQKDHDERLGQLYVMRGKEQIAVSEIPAGDIGAVAKLTVAETGDTLTVPQHPVRLPGIAFPAPAYSAAVHPKTKTDLDKMGNAIHRIIEEDPTLHVSRDPHTGDTLVSGLGESHVQIALDRMARKFGVNVDIALPQVAYRETISLPVTGIEHKHKKQSGGHGQYGHVFLDIEPLQDGDFEFAEKVVGGVVPRQYIPAVEKGVREALDEGLLAGYPIVNVKVTLTDGSYHTVDSSEMAFKIAASQAFKKGAMQAKPIILEPMMQLRVTIPESFMGEVMSDLNVKRAQVQGMVPGERGMTTIEAVVPEAEIQRYATDLRSITQGRGSFTVEFDHYQPVPANLTEQIVANAKAHQEALAAQHV